MRALRERGSSRAGEKGGEKPHRQQARDSASVPFVDGSPMLKRRARVLGAPVWRLMENLRPLKDMMATDQELWRREGWWYVLKTWSRVSRAPEMLFR